MFWGLKYPLVLESAASFSPSRESNSNEKYAFDQNSHAPKTPQLLWRDSTNVI